IRSTERESKDFTKIDVAAQRRIAEWVLSTKGRLSVELEDRQRKSVQKPPLPEGPLCITSIVWGSGAAVDEAGLKNLAGIVGLESLTINAAIGLDGLKSIEG